MHHYSTQHYPRKGTCTRHGNLRPIIPVTSRPKGGDEKPCGMGWSLAHMCLLLALCGAKLFHGPRDWFNTPPLQLGRSMHPRSTGIQSCDDGQHSINGLIVDEDTQTAVFVDVPLYTDYCLPDRRATAEWAPLSKICCSLWLLASWSTAGLDGSSGLGRPSDRLLRTCMRGWKV